MAGQLLLKDPRDSRALSLAAVGRQSQTASSGPPIPTKDSSTSQIPSTVAGSPAPQSEGAAHLSSAGYCLTNCHPQQQMLYQVFNDQWIEIDELSDSADNH